MNQMHRDRQSTPRRMRRTQSGQAGANMLPVLDPVKNVTWSLKAPEMKRCPSYIFCSPQNFLDT